jgi:hypothetical protein
MTRRASGDDNAYPGDPQPQSERPVVQIGPRNVRFALLQAPNAEQSTTPPPCRHASCPTELEETKYMPAAGSVICCAVCSPEGSSLTVTAIRPC